MPAALCNACASNCETGYEPAVFIRELRARIAASGMAPKAVQTVIERLLKTGTIYEVEASKFLTPQKAPDAELMLYVGQTAAARATETVSLIISLLNKSKVNFSIMGDTLGSGSEFYDLIGEVSETKAACKACAETINASKAKTLVVVNPSDARMFAQVYPAMGIELKPQIKTVTAYLLDLYQSGKLHIKKKSGVVTFHDPCRLARDMEETEPSRELLRAMGYEIKEMWQNKKLTHCCGGELMNTHSPQIAKKIAEDRMNEAVGTGAALLVTACPGCSANLSVAKGLSVMDICVLLDEATE